MMKKLFPIRTLLLFSFLLGVAFTAQGAQFDSKIEVKRGEKWWGVFLGSGQMTPCNEPFGPVEVSNWSDGQKTPLLISSTGRYIWSKAPFSIEFTGDTFLIGSDTEKIEAISGGRTLREAYLVCRHKNYPPSGDAPSIDLVTRPVYDPRIDLGISPSSDALLDYVRKLTDVGYPPGNLVIPAGWQTPFGSFSPDTKLYPDFRTTVKTLQDRGFKVMLAVTPFVSGDSPLFRKYRDQGYFLTSNDKRPVVTEWEGGMSVTFDLNHPEVAPIIHRQLDSLTRHCGIDGFVFDCTEAMSQIALAGDGRKKYLEQWNTLSNGNDFCLHLFTPGYGFTSYALHQQSEPLEWDFMSHALRNVVTANLLGYPFSTASANNISQQDLTNGDQQLLVRYMQFAAVMPVMTVSFGPWNVPYAETAAAFRATMEFRNRISEYIGSLVTASARTAEPILRHMEYEFPRNGFTDCDNQFMIGNRYLVAPLLGQENSRTIRFPRGNWTDQDGKRYRGPLVTEVNSSDNRILIFEAVNK